MYSKQGYKNKWYTQYIVQYTVYTVLYTITVLHSVQCEDIEFIVYIVYVQRTGCRVSSVYNDIMYRIQFTLLSTAYIVHCTVYNITLLCPVLVCCTLSRYPVYCMLFVYCMLYSVQHKMCIQGTAYRVHCTLYAVHCTLYTLTVTCNL